MSSKQLAAVSHLLTEKQLQELAVAVRIPPTNKVRPGTALEPCAQPITHPSPLAADTTSCSGSLRVIVQQAEYHP